MLDKENEMEEERPIANLITVILVAVRFNLDSGNLWMISI